MLAQSTVAMACVSIPQSFRFAGTSYNSLPIKLNNSGSVEFDGDSIEYNYNEKKWCVRIKNDKKCDPSLINAKGELEMLDTNNKKIGRIILKGASNGAPPEMLFMSIDASGNVDKTKPYIRIVNSSTSDGKNIRTSATAEAVDSSGVVGSATVSGDYYLGPNGLPSPKYRAFGSAGGATQELRGAKLVGEGCGSETKKSPANPSSAGQGEAPASTGVTEGFR